jgi:TorA maturation chaperone TorD
VSELARRIGISQPSVSNWDRVPAERVSAVESATGVGRAVLRPDLFGALPGSPSVDPIDGARAAEYALIATLMARCPDAELLRRLSHLSGDETPLGIAHSALAAAARKTNARDVEREYFGLFIGVGRGELLPYASYYLTGFLHERPLARIRGELQRIGVAKNDGQAEPEDHVAILFEVMSALTGGAYQAPPGTDRDFFQKHIATWVPRLFVDLERGKSANFYARVGALGRVFMDIEIEAFALPS